MGRDSDGRRLAGWLFVGFFGLYALIGGGHIDSPDGVVMSRVTLSLFDRGRVDIEPLANWPAFGGSPYYEKGAQEPRFYAKYGLGQSLAAGPGLLVGRILAPMVSESERGVFDTPFGVQGVPSEEAPFGSGNPFRIRWYDWTPASWPLAFEAWAMSWTNAWVVAATLALLLLLGVELGFGVRASLGMALVAGLATPLGHFAGTFFAEPLAGLGLVGFLLALARASRRERGTGLWAAAGLSLGGVVLAKVAHGVLLVPAGLLVAGVLWRRAQLPDADSSLANVLRAAFAFGIGLSVPLACIALYDFARFGDVFETGYAAEVGQWTTPLLEGFWGLLASPGKGLLWFAPIVIASAAAAPRFARRLPLSAGFVALSLVALLCLYARWYMWEGGWCWGPRFLIPVVPLLMLPLGALLSEMPRSRMLRLAVAALGVVSFVVTVGGLLVNPIDFHQWVKLSHGFRADAFAAAGAPNYYDLVRWDWRFSPLVANWTFPVKDAFLLPHALRQPGLVLGLHAVFAGAVAIAAWRIGQLLRGERAPALSGSEATASP